MHVYIAFTFQNSLSETLDCCGCCMSVGMWDALNLGVDVLRPGSQLVVFIASSSMKTLGIRNDLYSKR